MNIQPFEILPTFAVDPKIQIESINIEDYSFDNLIGIVFAITFVSL